MVFACDNNLNFQFPLQFHKKVKYISKLPAFLWRI